MTRPLAQAMVALALLSALRPAAAEEAGAVEAARQHFLRGVDLYREGDYQAALADFEQAYELAPHWGVLYNIGRVRAELRFYPEAVDALERYLREGGAEVPAERRREVQRELHRLRGLVGRVALEVERPSEALVYVDGSEVGRAPLSGPLLVSAGRRTVEVRAEGYMPFRREITVAGGAEQRLAVSLIPAAATSGSIYVSSPVPGLTVSVDGEPVGLTPLEEPITASPGRRLVEGTRPGYEPVARAVEVAAGELASVELDPRPVADLPADLAGSLQASASEAEAEVLVDGHPLEGERLPIGPHVVEVSLAGFHPWSRVVEVEASEPLRLRADLVPTEGYLERYRRRARDWQIGAWLTVAGGLAVLGTFVGLHVWTLDRHQAWQTDRDALDAAYVEATRSGSIGEIQALEGEIAESDDLLERHQLEDGLYLGGIALGSVIAATGIVLAFVGPSPWRYSRVALLPGPSSLALALAF